MKIIDPKGPKNLASGGSVCRSLQTLIRSYGNGIYDLTSYSTNINCVQLMLTGPHALGRVVLKFMQEASFKNEVEYDFVSVSQDVHCT